MAVNPYRAKPEPVQSDSISTIYAFYFHRGGGIKTIEAELKLNLKSLTGSLRKGNELTPLAAAKSREGKLAFGELVHLMNSDGCNLADVEELVDLLGLNLEPPKQESPYASLKRTYRELQTSIDKCRPAELIGIIESYGDIGRVKIFPDGLNYKIMQSGNGNVPRVIVFTGEVETDAGFGRNITTYAGSFMLSIPRHGQNNVLLSSSARRSVASDVDVI